MIEWGKKSYESEVYEPFTSVLRYCMLVNDYYRNVYDTKLFKEYLKQPKVTDGKLNKNLSES